MSLEKKDIEEQRQKWEKLEDGDILKNKVAEFTFRGWNRFGLAMAEEYGTGSISLFDTSHDYLIEIFDIIKKNKELLTKEERDIIADKLAETDMGSIYDDPQMAKDYLIDGRVGYLQMSDKELIELNEHHIKDFEEVKDWYVYSASEDGEMYHDGRAYSSEFKDAKMTTEKEARKVRIILDECNTAEWTFIKVKQYKEKI